MPRANAGKIAEAFREVRGRYPLAHQYYGLWKCLRTRFRSQEVR